MPLNRYAIFIFFILLFSRSAWAIVSMESLHTGPSVEGFSGTLEGAYLRKSGNSDRIDYSMGTRLQWHRDNWTNFMLLSGEYGKVAGTENTRKGFSHLRHIYQFTPLVAGEGFLQAEFDDFTRLEARYLAGGGARFTPYRSTKGAVVHLGTGLFREYERIDPKYPDGGATLCTRGNLYLVVKFPLGQGVAFINSTYLQPKIGDGADRRLLEQAALKTKITESLSLVFAIDHRRDTRPPLGVGENDTTVTTSFAVSF